MDKIQILQLGDRDWRKRYTVPDTVEIQYKKVLKKPTKKLYDLVILDRTPFDQEIPMLHKAAKAYTLFVTEHVEMTEKTAWLYRCKKGRKLEEKDIQAFLLQETGNYFSKPYGEKFRLNNLAIAQGFSGSVKWEGNQSVCLRGEFGTEFSQAACWRNNIPIFKGQCLELWLEYQKRGDVEIALSISGFLPNRSGDPVWKREFSEEELRQGVWFDSSEGESWVFISLRVRGNGELRIVGLHVRYSRKGRGLFIPGGEQYVTSNREEIFCYFDPGDMNPPLNVYFSGYKTQEGFEGYFLMKNLGTPFLLVAEARLEGGGFYMGSEEYETILRDTIFKYMRELHFTPDQVVLAGISMGSFGAMYYGCDIRPHTVLLGKPLLSIGDIAANGKLLRPGAFATSLDILRFLCGRTDSEAVEELNRRFWDKFDRTEWERTKIIAAYMLEDDYDGTAYRELVSHVRQEGVELYGKGLHGRHNDNSAGIVNWFVDQLKQILINDFHRKVDG